jgi:hypothetical protein
LACRFLNIINVNVIRIKVFKGLRLTSFSNPKKKDKPTKKNKNSNPILMKQKNKNKTQVKSLKKNF